MNAAVLFLGIGFLFIGGIIFSFSYSNYSNLSEHDKDCRKRFVQDQQFVERVCKAWSDMSSPFIFSLILSIAMLILGSFFVLAGIIGGKDRI